LKAPESQHEAKKGIELEQTFPTWLILFDFSHTFSLLSVIN